MLTPNAPTKGPVSPGVDHALCGGSMSFSDCPLCRPPSATGHLLLRIGHASLLCSKVQRCEGAGHSHLDQTPPGWRGPRQPPQLTLDSCTPASQCRGPWSAGRGPDPHSTPHSAQSLWLRLRQETLGPFRCIEATPALSKGVG